MTDAGRARAEALGIPPVPSQLDHLLRRFGSLDRVLLVRDAAEIIRGYKLHVELASEEAIRTLRGEFLPDLWAKEGDATFHVICESDARRAGRDLRWLSAATAGGSWIFLATTTDEALSGIVSEINALKPTSPMELHVKGFSVETHRRAKANDRKPLWTYDR